LLVPEPERDDGSVDTGVEEAHRGGVPQDVWGDGLVLERWALPGRVRGVVGKSASDRVAGERLSGAGRERRIDGQTATLGEPAADELGGWLGQRGDAILAAFAAARDVGWDREVDPCEDVARAAKQTVFVVARSVDRSTCAQRNEGCGGLFWLGEQEHAEWLIPRPQWERQRECRHTCSSR
jgi:hypothetical protein